MVVGSGQHGAEVNSRADDRGGVETGKTALFMTSHLCGGAH
ncbi:hypothetical protein EBESD8_5050 [Rhodococcus aetherivorans]|nr:hypothetical protein EBESD8_5050 [Rhodococcus aetherivorans]